MRSVRLSVSTMRSIGSGPEYEMVLLNDASGIAAGMDE